MAFAFARKHSWGKTWYVGYYVKGKLARRRVGRLKVIAGKALGHLEARLARGEMGLVSKDYPVLSSLDEDLDRTKTTYSASYHDRNRRVIDKLKIGGRFQAKTAVNVTDFAGKFDVVTLQTQTDRFSGGLLCNSIFKKRLCWI